MCMEMDISEHASDATNDTAMTTSLLKVNDGNAQEWAKFRQKFESMMAAKGATTAAQRIMHLNTLLKEGGYVATPNHGAGILAAGALFFLHAANAWQRVGKSPAWLPRLSLMPRPNAAASIESESMDISDMACPYDDGSQPPDLDGCSHNQPFHASSSSHLETKANTNANSSSSSSSSNNNRNSAEHPTPNVDLLRTKARVLRKIGKLIDTRTAIIDDLFHDVGSHRSCELFCLFASPAVGRERHSYARMVARTCMAHAWHRCE